MNSIHRAEAAAGSGRSEHRNVDIRIPVARQRESPTGPNVPCERRTDPAEPYRRHRLGKLFQPTESPRMGLSSGEVAEEVTGGSGPGAERALEANNQSPRAKREVRSSPELPCERRPRPAEPRRGTYPQRQPQHSAIAKKVRAPGCMRRSFRTHRLCAIPRGFTPGWYPLPRWGTPNASLFPEPPPPSPQHTVSTTTVFPQRRQSNHPIQGHTLNPRSGSGIGPERA